MGRRKVDIEKLNLFILNNINRSDLVKYTSETFNVSRQTIYRTINGLIQNKEIISVGNNRNKSYSLKINKQQFKYKLGNNNTDEYLIWVNDIKPLLTELPENVIDICHYGVTEMVNNVNDHSEASELKIIVEICSLFIGFWIIDDGIGIFTKIKNHFNLLNKNHAILELTKGKLTSDPSRHTGEGIFFTSRMFDHFTILSEDLAFLGHNNDDWLFPDRKKFIKGTSVYMRIERRSETTMNNIFNQFTSEGEDFGFIKTTIPVRLLQHEGDTLISRSQAKRLIVNFEKFKEVILDFAGVKQIGQPFADEVFRVFRNTNPETHLYPINTNPDIDKMIKHVTSA